jgi:hypothetical protein
VYGVGLMLLYWWKEGRVKFEWIDFLISVARGLRVGASGARTSWSDKLEVASGGAVPRGGCFAIGVL